MKQIPTDHFTRYANEINANDATQPSCTDLDLIQSAIGGSEDAFETLINRYKNLVYSIILRKTNNHQDANDLAQDVFLKIYKYLASYTPEFRFSTWVMRITTNHIIDQHRKKKIDAISYENYTEEGGSIGTTHSPESHYLKEEETQRIQKILDGLPEIYKTPVVLYHQNGLSYNEIAEEIGEPISKVKNRIFRGRKLLKGLLMEGESI